MQDRWFAEALAEVRRVRADLAPDDSALRFRDELEDHMSPDYAEETLQTVISWGRYAELFSFDDEADQFTLEDIDTA